MVFYLLYFSPARCARTHSESVVRGRHESNLLGVGFLFAVLYFSSARCARTHSERCKLQTRVFHTCYWFSVFCSWFCCRWCGGGLCDCGKPHEEEVKEQYGKGGSGRD